jgi:hypothetical protein
LCSGHLFIASPGIARDILDKNDTTIGEINILTDGEWAWPSDLAYYVEKYHARIPEEMLRSMERNKWKPPIDVDLKSLEL